MEGRYRKINNGLNPVDESLFGNGSGRNSRGSRDPKKSLPGPLTGPAVVISKSELERIRVCTVD